MTTIFLKPEKVFANVCLKLPLIKSESSLYVLCYNFTNLQSRTNNFIGKNFNG
jgi:hypothetical protein